MGGSTGSPASLTGLFSDVDDAAIVRTSLVVESFLESFLGTWVHSLQNIQLMHELLNQPLYSQFVLWPTLPLNALDYLLF